MMITHHLRVRLFFISFIGYCWSAQGFSATILRSTPIAQAKAKEVDNFPQKPLGFLWLSTNRHLDQKHISLLFHCDKKNQLEITIKDPGQPDHVKGLYGVIRLITNNTPPSGKGYKKFIYVSRFSSKINLSIHRKDIAYFLADLKMLREQVLKNQKMGVEEYDEKVKYCERLALKNRQKCFESSSGYQARPPLIALWIEVDEAKRSPGRFNSLFDPKELDQLKKLPCYKAQS